MMRVQCKDSDYARFADGIIVTPFFSAIRWYWDARRGISENRFDIHPRLPNWDKYIPAVDIPIGHPARG